MKPCKQFSTILSVLIALPAFASGGEGGSSGVGGGGNAVVCFDDARIPLWIRNGKPLEELSGKADQGSGVGELLDEYIPHITSIETYDLYTARLPRGVSRVVPQIVPLFKNESPSDYVQKIISRVESLPQIARILRDSMKRFQDRNTLFEPHGLSKVNDTAEIGRIDSRNCVLATLAIQYRRNQLHYLHIDDRLFNHPRHSDLSKAVLFLHEYIYRDERDRGLVGSSRNTQELVRLLITQGEGLTVGEAIFLAENAGFRVNLREPALSDLPHQIVAAAKQYYSEYDNGNRLSRFATDDAQTLLRDAVTIWKDDRPNMTFPSHQWVTIPDRGSRCHSHNPAAVEDCLYRLRFLVESPLYPIGGENSPQGVYACHAPEEVRAYLEDPFTAQVCTGINAPLSDLQKLRARNTIAELEIYRQNRTDNVTQNLKAFLYYELEEKLLDYPIGPAVRDQLIKAFRTYTKKIKDLTASRVRILYAQDPSLIDTAWTELFAPMHPRWADPVSKLQSELQRTLDQIPWRDELRAQKIPDVAEIK